jgi:hypothetical protein
MAVSRNFISLLDTNENDSSPPGRRDAEKNPERHWLGYRGGLDVFLEQDAARVLRVQNSI